MKFEDARRKRALLMSSDSASALHKKSGPTTFGKGEVLEVKSLQTRLLRVIENLRQYYEKINKSEIKKEKRNLKTHNWVGLGTTLAKRRWYQPVQEWGGRKYTRGGHENGSAYRARPTR